MTAIVCHSLLLLLLLLLLAAAAAAATVVDDADNEGNDAVACKLRAELMLLCALTTNMCHTSSQLKEARHVAHESPRSRRHHHAAHCGTGVCVSGLRGDAPAASAEKNCGGLLAAAP